MPVPSAVGGFPHPVCCFLQNEIAVSFNISSFSLASVFAGENVSECLVWLLSGVTWRDTAGSTCVSFLYSLFFCFMRLSVRVILIVEVVSGS